MKRQNIIFTIAAALLLAACSEMSDLQRENGRAADVPEVGMTASSSTADSTSATRAADGLYESTTGFDGGEEVEVYRVYGGATTHATYVTGEPYAESDGGTTLLKSDLAIAPGQTALRYASGSSGSIKLYGVYPAASTSSHTVAYDQTTDENYKKSDLMYANAAVAWSTYDEKTALATTDRPNLPFRHQLVKLRVVLMKMNDVSQVTRVTLHNVKRTTTVGLSETAMTVGTATTADDGSGDEILLSSGEEKAEEKAVVYTYCCLFPVQSWGDGDAPTDFLTIEADQTTTTYRLLRSSWTAGNEYTLTISLNDLALGNTFDITTWTESGGDVVSPKVASGGTLKINAIADETYDGSAHKPTPAVSYKGTLLTAGTDYDYQYFANTNAGTAIILAVGKTGTDYEGQLGYAQFTIQPRDISALGIAAAVDDATYNGSQQTCTATVTDKGLASGGTATLTENSDYTLSGNSQTNAGNYIVTVTGTGNYTGTTTATWQIDKVAATVTSAPTAKTDLKVGTDNELVEAGTTSDGTMYYYCSSDTEATPDASADGWSASIPTKSDEGTYYVYYYVKGDSNHTDSGVKGPVEVTVALDDPGVALADAEVGYIVAATGKAYPVLEKTWVEENSTIVGMVAYKNGSNGIVLANSDASETYTWQNACIYSADAGGFYVSSLTDSKTSMTWICGTSAQYSNALGVSSDREPYDYEAINNLLDLAGCVNLDSIIHWTSTEAVAGQSAWCFRVGTWRGANLNTRPAPKYYVRPMFEF